MASNRKVVKNGYLVSATVKRDQYFTSTCPTKKRGYLLRSAAKKAAKAAAKQGYGNMRAYVCDRCNFWHVGHSTQYNPRYKKV